MIYLLDSPLLTDDERKEAEEISKTILQFQRKVINRLCIEQPYTLSPDEQALFTTTKQNVTKEKQARINMLYKKLSKIYHPDLSKNNSQAINDPDMTSNNNIKYNNEMMAYINNFKDNNDLEKLEQIYNGTFIPHVNIKTTTREELTSIQETLGFCVYFRQHEMKQWISYQKLYNQMINTNNKLAEENECLHTTFENNQKHSNNNTTI